MYVFQIECGFLETIISYIWGFLQIYSDEESPFIVVRLANKSVVSAGSVVVDSETSSVGSATTMDEKREGGWRERHT